MATYTYSAIAYTGVYDPVTDSDSITSFDSSVDIVVSAPSGSGFSYTYIDPFDIAVDVDSADPFTVSVDGNDPEALGYDLVVADVRWTDGTNFYTTTIAEFSTPDTVNANGTLSYTSFIMVLGGDPLPPLNTLADAESFLLNNIVSLSQTSGALGPGQTILWSDLPYTDLVEDSFIDGTGGNDNIVGTGADDVIDADDGNDKVAGLAGNDTIDGGDGTDTVDYSRDSKAGGKAGVVVKLADGTATDGFGNSDTLTSIENVKGTNKKDKITGDAAKNEIEGLDGNDKIKGGGGNDLLDGGAGNDSLDGGGGGKDTANYSRDAKAGGKAGVVVKLADGTATDGFGDTDTLTGIENVTGTDKKDKITGDAAKNEIEGLDGNDKIKGGGGNDLLDGGDGNDAIDGGGGKDTVDYSGDSKAGGKAGIVVKLDEATATDGFGDTDTLTNIENVTGTNKKDKIFGDAAKNEIQGLDGKDNIKGGDGNDILDGGDGDDSINGGKGADVLIGGDGANSLNGGSGGDTIIGGAGMEMMSGGTGADDFIFANGFGTDVISDFEVDKSGEQIDLSAVGAIKDWNDLSKNHLVDSGTFVTIDDLKGNTITLENVLLSDLDASHFIF